MDNLRGSAQQAVSAAMQLAGITPMTTARCLFREIDANGCVVADFNDQLVMQCDLLAGAAADDAVNWAAGDVLLACLGSSEATRPVILGRIVRTAASAPSANRLLAATDTLTLRCGESSLTLQADGKVLLKGEDVVIRAKGTQRIRAGTVAIN